MLPTFARAPSWWLAAPIAGTIALAAWRVGSLSRSGAIAAVVVGTAALSASWGWGIYLIFWFATASLFSRIGRTRKAQRVSGIVDKGDRRDGWQVLANGGAFLVGALAIIAWPELSPLIAPAAAAALAAAGADTWSTEIGTLVGGQPWSLRLRRRVPAGTSGAVTLVGSMAGAMGAAALALFAYAVLLIDRTDVVAVLLGALAGAWTDTIVGAWWQSRRWCPACQQETEQLVHRCGTRTEQRGGLRPLSNDGVNLLCTAVGASVALLLTMLDAA